MADLLTSNPVSMSLRSRSLSRCLPALSWSRAYDWSWLRGDVLAGITLAAFLVPSVIADASLANLPPQSGLYACLFSGLVFWLFCNSPEPLPKEVFENLLPERWSRRRFRSMLLRAMRHAVTKNDFIGLPTEY